MFKKQAPVHQHWERFAMLTNPADNQWRTCKKLRSPDGTERNVGQNNENVITKSALINMMVVSNISL